jgi:hypothetical protein
LKNKEGFVISDSLPQPLQIMLTVIFSFISKMIDSD